MNSKRSLTRLLGAALATAGLSALAGCGTHSPPPLSLHEIGVARRFNVFDIYWVGRRFEGVPLTAADFRREYNPQLGLSVYYGDCEVKVSLLGNGGCTLPLEIKTVCYVQHRNAGLGPHRNTRIRGVPAVIYDGGKSIELYTGYVAIDVYADSPARALAAARHLFPLNGPPKQRVFTPRLAPPALPPDRRVKLPREPPRPKSQRYVARCPAYTPGRGGPRAQAIPPARG